MEFNKKLQELRKQKGLTQEELAKALFVSRTAVSKWESGKGYPSIDSLKAISALFSVSVDQLLSNEELLTAAEEDSIQKRKQLKTLVFALMDISCILLFFMPFFAQRTDQTISEVSLLSLTEIAAYTKASYIAVVAAAVVFGVISLALQNSSKSLWNKTCCTLSLILNISGVLLFITGLQPYAAVFLLVIAIIKAIIIIKKQ